MQIRLVFKLQLCHMNQTSEALGAALGETLILFCACTFWVCFGNCSVRCQSFNWWPTFFFVDAVSQYLADNPEACVPLLHFAVFWLMLPQLEKSFASLGLFIYCHFSLQTWKLEYKWMMSDLFLSQKRQPAARSWLCDCDLFIHPLFDCLWWWEYESCFGYYSHFCPFSDLQHGCLVIVVLDFFYFFFLRASFQVSEEAKNHRGSFLLENTTDQKPHQNFQKFHWNTEKLRA